MSVNSVPIKETTSVCSRCLTKVPAHIEEVEGQVFLEKTCPRHGRERALLSSDSRFYHRSRGKGAGGCGPGGCGPGGCALFNHSCTLIFEITERCNLTCPTCFTASSPHETWQMSLADFEAKLDRLLAGGKRGADIVQLSGGEPTIHPDVEAMIDLCFAKGVQKVYLNTNGIRLGREPDLAARLGRHAGRLQIYLQLDGFRDETFEAIRGAKFLDLKLKALEHALANGLYVLPVMTVTRGVNLDEIGDVIRFALERHPKMNGVMLQPAMYAGRYLNEQHDQRITVADIAVEVERQTAGLFSRADFGPIPCSDPNCFAMAVALVRGERVVPISRFFPPFETWSDPTVADRVARFADTLPNNMMEVLGDDGLVDELLDLLGDDDERVFGDHRRFFLVAVKPFMDAGSYDQDRVDACCVHVVDRAGNPVSLCEYNVLRRPRGLL